MVVLNSIRLRDVNVGDTVVIDYANSVKGPRLRVGSVLELPSDYGDAPDILLEDYSVGHEIRRFKSYDIIGIERVDFIDGEAVVNTEADTVDLPLAAPKKSFWARLFSRRK